MIDFDFENDFPVDYEIPLNSVALLDEKTATEQMDQAFYVFSESYLHAADMLFRDYIQLLTENHSATVISLYVVNMHGVIIWAYTQAIELRMKGILLTSYDLKDIKTHDISKLHKKINEKYIYYNSDPNYLSPTPFLNFIDCISEYSKDSQAGRYPVDSKNNIIGVSDDGTVCVNGLVNFVKSVHDLFIIYFPNLKEDPYKK